MRLLGVALAAGLLLAGSVVAPPPRKSPAQQREPQQPETGNGTADWDLGIEYNRYLQEVVQVRNSRPESCIAPLTISFHLLGSGVRPRVPQEA